MSKSSKEQRRSLATQYVVGLWGAFLSIALHEAFHIYMHWGSINRIEFFPNLTTIMQVDTVLPAGYDIEGEEIAAYCITLIVLIVTSVIIFKIRDTDDIRSAGQTLFPGNKKMQKMNPTQMLKLSGLEEPLHVAKKRKHRVATKK